jgi:hypothetical protein
MSHKEFKQADKAIDNAVDTIAWTIGRLFEDGLTQFPSVATYDYGAVKLLDALVPILADKVVDPIAHRTPALDKLSNALLDWRDRNHAKDFVG